MGGVSVAGGVKKESRQVRDAVLGCKNPRTPEATWQWKEEPA